MTTKTQIDFDTIMFKMEVDAYVKRMSMFEENIQKAYYLVLGKWNGILNSKLK